MNIYFKGIGAIPWILPVSFCSTTACNACRAWCQPHPSAKAVGPSILKIFFRGSLHVHKLSLTHSDKKFHVMHVREQRVSGGRSRSSPKVRPHTVWEITKFCIVIKLDVRKILARWTMNADARSVCGSYPSWFYITILNCFMLILFCC